MVISTYRCVGTFVVLFSLIFLCDISPINAQKPLELKIKSVFFGGGSYYIDEEQGQELIDFLDGEMLENYEIHIHSHTDNVGSIKFNKQLSQMRSWATKQLLISRDLPKEKIFIKDHGLENPEFNNETWRGRAQNRRVDVVLYPLPS
ncbi:MAG: OmpA family protein [Saprospiraceae bacterium]|nr:OmpA family protein [Saprospiraceae bacterium]